MKHIKIFSIVAFFAMLAGGCKTQMVERLDEFNLEQGGYMRTVNFAPYDPGAALEAVTRAKISKANIAGSRLESILEAVTPNQGSLFTSYDLSIRFVDTTPLNGNKSTAVAPFRSIPASAYAKDATTGYPRHTFIVTATEALAATQLTNADISAGDRWEITATMKLSNGKSFNAANTGLNITGGAFYSSPFFYRLNVLL